MRPLLSFKLRSLLALAFLLFLAATGVTLHAQTTRSVGSGQTYATIQSAINAAANGDTVLVYPGTYYENIDFLGKAITVTSTPAPAGGAANTIIDGGAANDIAVVNFTHGETRAAVLSNLTIRNGGHATPVSLYEIQGGIYVSSASPTILNNLISANQCTGIVLYDAAALVQGNTITGAIQPSNAGCTLYALSGLLIEGWLRTASPYSNVVVGNTIANNPVGSQNGNYGFTGGIYFWSGDYTLVDRNIFHDNRGSQGGAITSANQNVTTIIGNLFYSNSGGQAGAIDLMPPDSTVGPLEGAIVNNTFANNHITNTSSYPGDVPASQIYISSNLAQYALVNNVVVGNDPGTTAINCDVGYNSLSLTPVVFDHNDVAPGNGVGYAGACSDQTGTFGNINGDPLFRNEASADYTLISGSPAIDSGNNSAPALAALDLGGNPRIVDATGKGYPVIDMGAYEVAGTVDAPTTIVSLSPSHWYGSTVPDPFYQQPLTFIVALSSAAGQPTGPVTIYVDGNPLKTTSVGSSGSSTFQIPGLLPGTHTFVASYAGNSSFPPGQSVKFFLIVPYPVTKLTISSSPNPSIVGATVQFAVTASSTDGSIPSPLQATDTTTNTALATLTPDSSGNANFTASFATVGTHVIQISFAGDQTHQATTAQLSQQVVAGLATTTTLTSSANPSNYAQPVTFTAKVAATGSTNIPSGAILFSDGHTTLATVALDASGSATYTTSTLTANDLGTSTYHQIAAVFVPAAGFSTSSASLNQVVTGLPAVATLVVTPTTGTTATTYTLTATLSSGTSSSTTLPTGDVVFYTTDTLGQTGREIGNAVLVNGVATLSAANFLGGSNYVNAVYLGDSIYASTTSNPVLLTIAASPSTTTISESAASITELTPVTFTVQLATSAPNQALVANLPVTLRITPTGGGPEYFQLTTDATGKATYTISSLFSAGVGPEIYNIGAFFTGNASLLLSNSTVIQLAVNPAPATTTTASVSPNPSTYGLPVVFTAHVTGTSGPSGVNPTGQVEFDFCHGATTRATLDASGNASFIYPLPGALAEPVGSCPFTVTYLADANYPKSTSASIPWTVTPSGSAMTLTSSAPGGYFSQPITFTATISGNAAPVLGPGGVILPPATIGASGAVQFFANGTLLGAATIVKNVATLTSTTLPVGTDTITAVYAGDADLTGSSAGPLTEIIGLPDFTIAAPQPSITIQTRHKGSLTLDFAALTGFNGPVAVTCAMPLPSWLTCEPPTVQLPLNGTATGTLTLDTDGVPNWYGALRPGPNPSGTPRGNAAARIALAGIALLPFFGFGGATRRARRLRHVFCLLLIASATLGLSSCANTLPEHTAAGTYTLQLQATGQSANIPISTTHTVAITLIVTP